MCEVVGRFPSVLRLEYSRQIFTKDRDRQRVNWISVHKQVVNSRRRNKKVRDSGKPKEKAQFPPTALPRQAPNLKNTQDGQKNSAQNHELRLHIGRNSKGDQG